MAKNISLRCKENESWSYTYCIMHWSGHLKKMHRVSAQSLSKQLLTFFAAKVQISTSESGPKYILGSAARTLKKMYLLSAHVSTLEFAGNGPRWPLKGYPCSCNFFAFYAQYGRSFFLSRWRFRGTQDN